MSIISPKCFARIDSKQSLLEQYIEYDLLARQKRSP
jgi:hypothetical protein